VFQGMDPVFVVSGRVVGSMAGPAGAARIIPMSDQFPLPIELFSELEFRECPFLRQP
jgi:hypothetical protein